MKAEGIWLPRRACLGWQSNPRDTFAGQLAFIFRYLTSALHERFTQNRCNSILVAEEST